MQKLTFTKFAKVLCGVGFLSIAIHGANSSAGFYKPQEGFVTAQDLPDNFKARILSITYDQRDAFDGSVAHSQLERKLFLIGNKLHIASKQQTIQRRLLFMEGDLANKVLLTETERSLRTEEFLADAVIEVKALGDSACDIRVTTFDQWTTIPGAGASVLGIPLTNLIHGRFGNVDLPWWIGLSESNLLGGGTKLGAALRHDRLRDTRELSYKNTNLSPLQLQLSAYGAWRSDGDSLLFKIERPLLSSSDKYAFGINLVSMVSAERVYFDANRLNSLPPALARQKAKSYHELRLFEGVSTQEINLSFTRSFGYGLKFDLGPTFDFYDHYGKGQLGKADTLLLQNTDPLPTSALAPEARTNAMLGVSLSLYHFTYQSARNYHNLKWNESVPLGWRINSKVALNQVWMGASNEDFRILEEALYKNVWSNLAYLSLGASWESFLTPKGHFENGQTDAWYELQWKPYPVTATVLNGAGAALLSVPKSRQLLLGEANGLSGFPSIYYAGQARLLFTAEQRIFPAFEFLTAVPAFALILSGGNTFPSFSEINPGNLHYSLGLGLRVGSSKSTSKVVQHFNVCWPLGEKLLPGPTISGFAKRSL